MCLVLFLGQSVHFGLPENSGQRHQKGLYLYCSLSPNVIVMSLVAFIVLRRLSEKILIIVPVRMHCFILYASRLSFGVYLIHPLIAVYLDRYLQLIGGYPTIWIAIPLFIIVVVLLALLVCGVILKIPIVKNIISDR